LACHAALHGPCDGVVWRARDCRKKCCVESAPPDGGRNTYSGEIVIATLLLEVEMEVSALALFVGSASLIAVTVTGFKVGTVAGAT